MKRSLFLICCVALALLAGCGTGNDAAPPPPPTEIDRVFGRIDCVPRDGMRFCEGSVETRVPSFDGVPLDVNVGFPPDSVARPPFPLVVRLHGYTGTKEGPYLGGAQGPSVYTQYTDAGFAVLTFTARGRGASCGTEASRKAAPAACTEGWDHLGDARHSIRDVQHLSGWLVDQGLVELEIGVQGGSYGGGRSLLLATLRDRMQTPEGDYVPWTSPKHGVEMEVGAAVPFIAWSDLTYALAPNGRVLDYAIGSDSLSRIPVGAMKHSLVQGLWKRGRRHYNAPPGADSSIDLSTWLDAFPTSGPLTDASRRAAREFTEHHSAIGVPMDRPPAPTLIANGFTDDLFPVDESVRWVTRIRTRHPDTSIAQLYGDFGHRRANQSSAPLLRPRAMDWFQRYLQDEDVSVPDGVEVFEQACGGGFGERHHAETWKGLAAGEVRVTTKEAATIPSDAENPRISRQIDPPSGRSEKVPSGSCRMITQALHPATMTVATAPAADPLTLVGAPTVVADLRVEAEAGALLVGRLWDVDPAAGTRTLITRGLVRPPAAAINAEEPVQLVFQLHPNAYPLAPGHRAELQLLGRSTSYVRPPSTPFAITVESIDLRLPVAEAPGAAPEVQSPAPRVLPGGMRWAPGYGEPSSR
jgi:hypothetical protein